MKVQIGIGFTRPCFIYRAFEMVLNNDNTWLLKILNGIQIDALLGGIV